ncbi:MAG: signal recognition particle-docking protein FtsY [Thiobacillaceae bacterium]|nr:signal recognition particle-docking protein FtsY [Thiobacillaceae bacterium]MDW8323157.1 signal recognition particle-docking protein FtsY [Burkholderiales bacterium]
MFGFLKSKPDAAPTGAETAARKGWLERLKAGLTKTRRALNTPVGELFRRHARIDEALYEELEEVLLTADVGVEATQHLIEALRARVRRDKLSEVGQLREALKALMIELLGPLEAPLDPARARPFVIMLAGVNGAGKTTTIGKLAWRFQLEGRSVLLAAGDTFRAAAREQLAVWGERNRVEVVTGSAGADPAAVIFDAVQSARARGIDVVLADTAGRLPTQLHLMEELKKVRRVIQKADPTAPHEVLLVLDANTGQNALAQVKAFDQAIQVTGLVLTKLDGTAKGGVIAALARRPGHDGRPIPVRYIGVGEGLEDLQPFRAREFVEALFADDAGNGA